jgi:hypothetical protein
MAKTSKEAIIRKLPLPLQIILGDDTVVTDGFFRLTSKEAKQINIINIDNDGYATIEILPCLKPRTLDMSVIVEQDAFLGAVTSKSRGSGKDFGQYKYYRRLDGSFYAVTSGKRNRKIKLGKITDRSGRIFTVATVIDKQFHTNEFTKKQLTPLLPKRLSHGQMLKALLDVIHLLGYLEKREVPTKGRGGRLCELFKATSKLKSVIYPYYDLSPEQA